MVIIKYALYSAKYSGAFLSIVNSTAKTVTPMTNFREVGAINGGLDEPYVVGPGCGLAITDQYGNDYTYDDTDGATPSYIWGYFTQ